MESMASKPQQSLQSPAFDQDLDEFTLKKGIYLSLKLFEDWTRAEEIHLDQEKDPWLKNWNEVKITPEEIDRVRQAGKLIKH